MIIPTAAIPVAFKLDGSGRRWRRVVHAVGMYGHKGGVAAQRNGELDCVLIGKAFGVFGGYMRLGRRTLFTTALPSSVAVWPRYSR